MHLADDLRAAWRRRIPQIGHFVSQRRRGIPFGLIIYFVVGLMVGAGALVGFVALGRIVEAGTTLAFDDRVLEWMAASRTPAMDTVMLRISLLGSTRVLLPLLVVMSVGLLFAREHRSVALLWIAIVGGHVLTVLLKALYNRPRPFVVPHATEVSSSSFPSGHAMSAMIAYATIGLLLGRLSSSRAVHVILFWAVVAISILVGVSRIYLGVHYPSDVVAGYAAGAAWMGFVAAGALAMQLVRRSTREH